jgi:hypothetical protein
MDELVWQSGPLPEMGEKISLGGKFGYVVSIRGKRVTVCFR